MGNGKPVSNAGGARPIPPPQAAAPVSTAGPTPAGAPYGGILDPGHEKACRMKARAILIETAEHPLGSA